MDIHNISWEGDVYKDMVTYRYLELSVSLLELAMEEDENLQDTYEKWLSASKVPEGSKIELNEEFLAKSAVLADYTPQKETKATLFALPVKDEFVVFFVTPKFKVTVSFSYDFKKEDIGLGKIVAFGGDAEIAIGWAEDVLDSLDKVLEEIQA